MCTADVQASVVGGTGERRQAASHSKNVEVGTSEADNWLSMTSLSRSSKR